MEPYYRWLVLSISVSVPPLALAAALRHAKTPKPICFLCRTMNRQMTKKFGAQQRKTPLPNFKSKAVVDYGIFALDKKGTCKWNSAAQKIMGYTAEEIYRQAFGIFYRRMSAARAHQTAHWNWLQRGKHEVEVRIRKNGTRFYHRLGLFDP